MSNDSPRVSISRGIINDYICYGLISHFCFLACTKCWRYKKLLFRYTFIVVNETAMSLFINRPQRRAREKSPLSVYWTEKNVLGRVCCCGCFVLLCFFVFLFWSFVFCFFFSFYWFSFVFEVFQFNYFTVKEKVIESSCYLE